MEPCHGIFLINIAFCRDFIHGNRVPSCIDHQPPFVSPDPFRGSRLHHLADGPANSLPPNRARGKFKRRILSRILSRNLVKPHHLCGMVYPAIHFYHRYGIRGSGLFFLLVVAAEEKREERNHFGEVTGVTHRKPTFSKYSSSLASVR